MTTSNPIDVPDAFAASYGRNSGASGRAWITALPGLAAEFLDRWTLRPDGPAGHGMASLVLPVTRADGNTPLPTPRGRLNFRTVKSDEEAIGLLARILPGTLDAYSRADIARSSIEEYARFQYHDELLSYSSPREWWRIGVREDGEPVGLVVPARSPNGFVIAYIGVAEGHRGHGYVDDCSRKEPACRPPRAPNASPRTRI
ncbi:hypothetical protein [Streptomyces sp. NBC_00057]|uniref:hypothetical protein n=1 Tax=Streptomyces sp. NBC_00057 TaxID=2975634 RepID=UPI00386FD618